MTTVLLLDPGWPQSGYLIVALRRAGFDIVRATPDALDHLGMGAYCAQISAPDGFTPEFVGRVLAEVPADVVLPLTEEIMMILWDMPPEATSRVFPATTERQRRLLTDRRAMYAFATSCGVPIPDMRDPGSEEGLAAVGEELGFPFVLRGTQGIGGVQVKIVRDLDSARRAWSQLAAMSPDLPFAQRMVHGRRCLIGGLFDGGRMLQWFSQTTLESDSPPTGPSIRVRSLLSPDLTAHAERLFAGFGWDGLACAEFMQDEKGGFHFMEINPRPWAAIQAAHVCGVPLLRSFAAFLRDRSAPEGPSTFRVDREVSLFPQYFSSRFRTPMQNGLRGVVHLLSSLGHAPWMHPRLMLHILRKMWWQRR